MLIQIKLIELAFLLKSLSVMMKIIATECSEEQTKQDAPELMKMHAQALKTDMMWEFFGGTITLPNGNQYQVINV